jgi:SlyX protein
MGGEAASTGGMMDRTEELEERIAHLTRAVDDLSDVVARQGREIDRLTRLTHMLAEREAEREAGLGDAPAANVKPPHW